MYLHIGTNTYLSTERIVGIFPRTSLLENPAEQSFLKQASVISLNLQPEEAKSCILTDTNELYLSKINARTLRQRWNALIM